MNVLLIATCKFICSDELRSNIRAEIEQSKSALESAISLSNDALQQANHVYDEALSLIANINALSVPDINLEKLRTDAMNAIQEVKNFDQKTFWSKKKLSYFHIKFQCAVG